MESNTLLSVILPVYNAMPWLTFAVRDMLKQQLPGDAPLEILASHDGGSDGSLEFLLSLVKAIGPARASDEIMLTTEPAVPSNPALLQPLRASEGADHPSFAGTMEPAWQEPLSAAAVAAAARPEHRLRVLRRADGANRGQGAAMSLALAHARSGLIAQMESDDERSDPHAFRTMLEALEQHPEWDGVSCAIELIGWERPGMQAYAAWQNRLERPEEMAAGRFIEIPALHQTALFRRPAVEEVLATSAGAYRDGARTHELLGASAALDASEAAEAAHADALDVPVDLWWWLSFFHARKRCGKVCGAPLLGWRQHPRQHTRTHGRLSIENLRRIKVHFLLRRGGPLFGCTRVVVISVGSTLHGWAADLRAHPNAAGVEVVEVAWAPGKKGNAPLPPVARLTNTGKRKLGTSEEGGARPGTADTHNQKARHVMRVWAFGRDEVRHKVRERVEDFDEHGPMPSDVFVA